ncbi:MAG: hypothetical protein DRP32_01585 [Thermotogae bacterium]|uniref:DUF2922 domain-containing protein n=1 Tax=Kosmotoga sp. TaxID=1955248 RepID=UPI000F1DB7D4|nr:DUF2922 domain-containing protein [Kosmotoga sp.]MBO8166393.1 DUF2922 domain-containing protein [Kosmotoga sp.]MCD6159287.1 DUF2922 domain-containing protein [Kosmotoga sp.]RKX50787.1 MAG: hypothetical protein DRP32_01585 [Thermotogota bacterium]
MKTLNMRWYDSAQGKSKGLVLRSPKDGLTQAEVQNVMDALVTLKVIPSNYATDYASVIDKATNELFNLI